MAFSFSSKLGMTFAGICGCSLAFAAGDAGILVPSWPASPPPIEFQARVDNLSHWANVLSTGIEWLNDEGFRREVDAAIVKAGPEIENMFNWTEPRGILIQIPAEVYKVPPEVGNLRKVIGGSAIIHGPGDTAVRALAADLYRGSVQAGPDTGFVKSPQWSRYIWVTKDKDMYVLSGIDYASFTRQGGAMYANTKLLEATAVAEYRATFLNMVKAYSRTAKMEGERLYMQQLQESARDALRDMDRINKQTQDRLQSIARANEVADMLQTMGSALTLASQIGMAVQAFGTNTPSGITNAKSTKELNDAIAAARAQLMQDVETLQRLYKDSADIYVKIQEKAVPALRKEGAPTHLLSRPGPAVP